MTEIFDVFPLSPVREWAISRSFTSSLHKADLWPGAFSRQQHGSHRNDLARRLPGATAGRRTIGIERLDLVADPDCFAQTLGAATDANAHLVGLFRRCRNLRAVQGIDSNQIKTQLAGLNACEIEPLADDFQRQPSPRQRTRARIGNLTLA